MFGFTLSGGFVTTKIHNIVNFPFLEGDILVVPMMFIFLNLFDLLECPVMIMTWILVIKF